MSHAAIYDAATDHFIDAVSSGVREVTAEQFLGAQPDVLDALFARFCVGK